MSLSTKKVLDDNGLAYLWSKVKNIAGGGVVYGTVTGTGTSRTMEATGFNLQTGTLVAAKFNSAVGANTTLDVNSSGAKSIYYKGSAIVKGIIDTGDTAVLMYDGSYWQVLAVDTAVASHSVYGTCSTVSGREYIVTVSTNTPIKVKAGSIITVKFSIDVTQTLAFLSGGVPMNYISYKGSSTLPADTIKRGDTAMFVYDGTNNYHLIAIDNLGGGGSYADGDAISY